MQRAFYTNDGAFRNMSIYFDNAATTFPKPESVYTAMDECARTFCVNAGRGQYTQAAKASSLIKTVREKMENLFLCNVNQTCVFTDSATTALNTIIHGLSITNDSNIYITPFEHNAVLRPLYAIKASESIQLDFNTDTLEFDFSKIKNDFEKRKPDFIFMSHVSNAFGFITPVKEIATLAKKINPNVVIILDCSQSVGLIPLDMSSNLFDFAVFAGHKTLYGPFGIAGFICNKNTSLKSFMQGGTGIDSKNKEMPQNVPERFEAGSHNIIAFAGLNAALDEIDFADGGLLQNGTLLKKDAELRERLIEVLSEHKNIQVFGENLNSKINAKTDSANQQIKGTGIVATVFENYTSDEIANVLNKFNICVRSGLDCAPFAHQKMGTFPAGTVRFSVGRFTSDNDFTELEKALTYIEENS